MDKDMVVSVIIPMYNAENVVTRLLDSFNCKSINKIEIVIVDDGSSDKSVDVCQEYAKKHSNYRISIYSKKNGGSSSARNYGLLKASCEYLVFCDADDEMEDGAFDYLVECFSDSFDWFVYQHRRTEKSKEKVVKPVEGVFFKEDIINNLDVYLTDTEILNSPVTKIYRKSLINKYRIEFDEGISIGEDLKFNLTYLDHIEREIIISRRQLYIYHTEDSGSTVGYIKDFSRQRWESVKFLEKYCKKYNLEVNIVRFLYIKYVYASVFMMCKPESDMSVTEIRAFIKEERKKIEISDAISNYEPDGIINRVLRNILKIDSTGLVYVLMRIIDRGSYWVKKRYRRASV